VNDQRHASATLYPPGEDSGYQLDMRLGGPQSWSGRTQYENKIEGREDFLQYETLKMLQVQL